MDLKVFLTWMKDEDRPFSYVTSRCGVDGEHLIDLLCGPVSATGDELASLAVVMGVPVKTLQRARGAATAGAQLDPWRCYSIADAANFLGVGRDRVDQLIADDEIAIVEYGDRSVKVPGIAIVDFIRRRAHYGRRKGKSSDADPGQPPPPLRVPPGRDRDDEDDGPAPSPEPRLL